MDIPEARCLVILRTLHTVCPGMVQMKAPGRSYAWWPGLDTDIERVRMQCMSSFLPQSTKSSIFPSEVTKRPWSHVYIVFVGPFQGKTILIIMDSFSKWLGLS